MSKSSVNYEEQAITGLVTALEGSGWTCERAPRFGGLRPDLFVRGGPTGDAAWVVEVKYGRGNLHSGDVGQLARWKESLPDVGVILVTTETVPDSLREAARRADFDIITIDPDNVVVKTDEADYAKVVKFIEKRGTASA